MVGITQLGVPTTIPYSYTNTHQCDIKRERERREREREGEREGEREEGREGERDTQRERERERILGRGRVIPYLAGS